MLDRLDSVTLSVDDLDAAERDYRRLFGRPAGLAVRHPKSGAEHRIWPLDNTRFVLAENGIKAGGLSIAFGTGNAGEAAKWLETRGFVCDTGVAFDGGTLLSPALSATRELPLCVVERDEATLKRTPPEKDVAPAAAVAGLDHVVVRSSEPEGTKTLFGDEGLGIRLALEREVEEWGGTMLFFRIGGATVEVVGKPHEDPAKRGRDRFWGLAWKVPDVAAIQERLAGAGCDVSEVRKGRKPGTLVATVRDGTGGVPTLLIGPDPDAG